MKPLLGEDAPLLPFLLAVIFSSWIGSTTTGIFTVIGGGAIGVYFFIAPYSDFGVKELPDLVRLTFFLVEGISLSIIIGSLKKTKKELQGKSLELRKAKNDAEISNKSKSLFLANMSHEIRTPMTAILGFTEVLRSQELNAVERDQYLKIIQRSATALCHLIDGILDLSKVEAGKMELEIVAFSPRPLIREIVSLFDIKAQEKGLKLTQLEMSLPDLVHSDPTKLRQIITNVLSNAVKFTDSGSIDVTSEFERIENKEGFLKITVKDSGVGITREQEKYLFKPFVQADSTTTRKFGGTGLGLSLSRQLARKLGGNLTLESSAPGKGSTFLISALVGTPEGPTTSDTPKESSKTVSEETKVELQKILEGKKVLLVEDSADNQLLLTCFLTSYGMTVEVASDGQDGVAKALRTPHDIVLMDIQMPRMDGFEALESLRKKGYEGNIIALTAHSMIEEQQKCLESGFNGFLSKPIARDTLVRAIAEMIT